MSIGVWQVVLILVIVLIIFGAGKLPRVAGDLAKGIRNFKTGMNEELDEENKEAVNQESAEPAPEVIVKKDETAKS